MTDDTFARLIYLWTRDAGIPVDNMEAYVVERLPMLGLRARFTDTERGNKARRIVQAYKTFGGVNT